MAPPPGICPTCGMKLVEASAMNQVDGIANLMKINDTVWTAGQPTLEHFTKLKEEGVTTIINLRPHSRSC
jgi:hypothetical protein